MRQRCCLLREAVVSYVLCTYHLILWHNEVASCNEHPHTVVHVQQVKTLEWRNAATRRTLLKANSLFHARRHYSVYISFFSKFLFVYFCLPCFVWKVVLMDNIKNELHDVCIPLPGMVSVSTDVWPLTWLDRLIHFLGAAWKFYCGLWLVWSAVLCSTMVHIHALYTEVVTPAAVTRGMGGPTGTTRLVGGLVKIACRCCFGGPLLI